MRFSSVSAFSRSLRAVVRLRLTRARRLLADCRGSVATMAGLTMVPLALGVGAAVDYSRAGDARAALQAAIDSAVLAGAKDGSAGWAQIASNTFGAVVTAKSGAAIATPSFTLSGDRYSGTVSASVPSVFMGLAGYNTMNVTVSSAAIGGLNGGNSCILTLDRGAALSDVSLLFGGAPNITLTNCAVRSNTSLSCNGHDSGATASLASGTASSCSNAQSGVQPARDLYAPLAANITALCGNSTTGVTWAAGGPKPSTLKTVTQASYTEYHVCGDLTVSGTGALFDDGADAVVVIENGSLNAANNATISTVRTAIILTGNGSRSSTVNFPNGNGQSATLTLSPPISEQDPWRGIALYQDPALTTNVNDNWGPGATLNADGVIYLPNASVVMRGVANSSNYQCNKFVSGSFQTNGSVTLKFAQQNAGCDTIGMKKWSDVQVRLTQ